MGEIGSDGATRASTANGVTHRARPAQKNTLTGLCQRVGRLRCRPPLLVEPVLEIDTRLGHDVERHLRVLIAAELGALTPVNAGRVRSEPGNGLMSWNEILFSREIRRPEAVNDVCRSHLQQHRAANWNMDLVRRLLLEKKNRIVVIDFPPPLVPDDINPQRLVPANCRYRATSGYAQHKRREENDDGGAGCDDDA